MGMTYIKADSITPALGASAAVVVDLGLGIDEAARIQGIMLDLSMNGDAAAIVEMRVAAAYSFDPEDLVWSGTDDEQFASCIISTLGATATTTSAKQSEHAFFDFTGMQVVTTRNLALVATAAGLAATVSGKVYYEKFKPSAIELSQLIATRR